MISNAVIQQASCLFSGFFYWNKFCLAVGNNWRSSLVEATQVTRSPPGNVLTSTGVNLGIEKLDISTPEKFISHRSIEISYNNSIETASI
jgi:hypothetical protein